MDIENEKPEITEALEKVRIENLQLKEKINSLESIIEESAAAIIIGNNKGDIIDVNKKLLDISLFDRSELLNKKVDDLLIRENIPAGFSRKEKKEPSDEYTCEQILVKKNGKKIFVSVRTKLLPDNQYQLIINNIHKRKKAELELIESEKRYRILVENIHDVVWTASKSLKIVYISPSITKITGYTPEVYYSKLLHELVTPISYQLIRQTFRKEAEMLRTGSVSPTKHKSVIEIKLTNKNYDNVWVELTATVIRNQFGKPSGLQGVLRNIDEQKKAKEILAKKQQLYDFALKSTGSGVWELSADLTNIFIDENLLNILGYTSEEIKPLLNEWIKITEKKDRLMVIDTLQDLLDGKKVTMNYECRRKHKTGEILWFNDYVEAIVNENGKVIGIIGTSKNITKEKIIEDKKYIYYAGLQKLTDSAFHLLKLPNLNHICDYAGKILLQNIPNSIIVFSSINPETKECKPYKFYGVNEPKLAQLIKDIDFVPLENSYLLPQTEYNLLERKTLIEYEGGFPAYISSVFPDREAIKINEIFKFHNLHIIGMSQEKTLSGSISIISREKTEIRNKEFIEAFINLISIIINRKNIETELENLNTTKDKFFSIISHDLKNPFNTFIGFSGLIVQNIDTISKEKTLEFAKHIHDGALRGFEMMQNLFEWVQTQNGTIVVRPMKINFPDFVESIINLFQGEASKKSINLNLKTKPEFDFYTDIDILSTILRNLISNALKFTNIGGYVEISYEMVNNSVKFKVKDNGIGMSKENMTKLFNVHTNVSNKGTENETGTGLGLILCKEFTEKLGGNIQVESEEGTGSCFSFEIPEAEE